MIEAIQAGLTASALFLFAIMIVALVAFAAAPVMKEAWTKWRKRGKLDKVVSLVAVGIAIAYGGSKSHDVPNAGADDGIALVGISAEHDPTNDVTAVNVKFTAGDVTVSTPVSVRNAESEQWRALEKIDATVTTGQTNVLAFAVAGNAATNRYWWVGVDTPAVIIESQGITITNFVATSKSVRIDWTCDDPKATVFAIQRKRKKPAGILYDAEVEYLKSDGAQYINTGIGKPGIGTITYWEAEAGFDSSYSATRKFTAGYEYHNMMYYCEFNNSQFGGAGWNVRYFCNATLETRKLYKVSMSLNGRKATYSVVVGDDTITKTVSPASQQDIAIDGKFMLFCMSRQYNGPGVMIGKNKLWINGVLVRDYIAVRKDGVGYMYDRVSGQLFGNNGTGAFAYGSDTLSYDWETVDTTSANTYTFSGFTIGEDWEWRIMSTYTEGDE